MKTFILRVDLPTLPGCSSWGFSQQGALANIKDAAEAYIEDMIDAGEDFPPTADQIEVIDEPAVAVCI